MLYSLSDYIKQINDKRVDSFFAVCFPICNLIEEQHGKGIILKKLNPDIIYMDPQNEKAELRFNSGGIHEFLPYVSPEQTGRINRQVDERSDFYSLGVIFYRLLTGKLPFQAQDFLGWCYAHISIKPKSPHELNQEIPFALSSIIMKLLAKSPDERYQSIYGLKNDLARCCQQWREAGKIELFTLGQADIPHRLQFQSKLFGREEETAVLIDAFNKVCQGSIESVIISGYPGIGKTALVQEFAKYIASGQGQFICGCYRQFQEDIPYIGIIQAIQDLIRQILAEPKQKIKRWGNRIQQVLGINGGIMTDIIPELKLISGEFPSVREIPPRESENRFFQVFKSFLQIFIQGEHPLVLFLDDLQWIDPASKKLIEAIMTDTSEGRLLFIGAYRTNEVDKSHPVFSLIQTMEKSCVPVREIMLEALDKNNTQDLIKDILKCAGKEIKALVNVVFRKSAGNPLYIKQILQNIYEDGYLYFSSSESCWKYKDVGLQNINVEGNIVEYVVNRIKKLPQETVDVIKFASCLGKKFNIDTLSASLNQSADWIEQALQPALNMGIIIEEADKSIRDNLLSHSEQEKNGIFSVGYEFLHDRVKEAAYSLMTEAEKKAAHYRAGRAILENIDSVSPGIGIFEAVDHLNLSIDLIRDVNERVELAEYNLKAGEKAKLSIALSSALKYFETGIKLLPENSWNYNYNLSFKLYLEYYWCMFSCYGFSRGEPIFEILINKAKSRLDKMEIYFRKTMLCTGYYRPEEAILSGLAALDQMGLRIPINPGKIYLIKEILFIKQQLIGKENSLLDLSEMSNDRAKRIMSLLANLTPPTSLINPNLFSLILLKMTNISLRYGNTDYSSFAYACYGIICSSRLGDFKKAVKMQEIALALAEKYNNYSVKCKVYYTVGIYLSHWNKHLRNSLKYGEMANYYAHETGDWLMMGVVQTEMVQIKCMLGESLRGIHDQFEIALEHINYGMPDSLNLLNTINQFIKNLKGETINSFSFSTEDYDENTVADSLIRTNKGFIVSHYYLMKIQSYYLHGGYMEAYDTALKSYRKLDSVLGKMLYAENIYWACLTASAAYELLDMSRQKKAKSLIKNNLRQLKKWSEVCEENFLHKYSLVSAEQHRLKGNIQEAMDMYQEAIFLAQKNGFTLDMAVAYELAARFYLKLGFEKNGLIHMVSAYQSYVEFGAVLKARLLKEEFPQILSEIEKIAVEEEMEKARKNSAAAIEEMEISREISPEISAHVDYLILSRVTDSFCESKDLEISLKKLLNVIVESSGAQRACLMTVKDEKLVLIAKKEMGQVPVVFPKESKGHKNRLYSQSVVMYVLNSGKSVIIDDAMQDITYNNDSYIRQKEIRSVLCLPIFLQDNLEGILYLENNITPCAFILERTEIIKKLALQAINTVRVAMMLNEKNSMNEKKKQYASELLTEKEIKILELMVEGLSNREIAERIFISEGTVKWHTNRIYKSLNVGNRAQAVIKAKELGFM
ncbi:MAG: AAA family ATPase [Bacillota bacterium]